MTEGNRVETALSEFESERMWLKLVLDNLRVYNQKMLLQKRETEESIETSLKMYDIDNKDQYAEVLYHKALLESLSLRTKISTRSLLKPYFSRVDFTGVSESKPTSFYLGKMSIFSENDAKLLVVDWRAPVASLYYEGRIGVASYECPDGHIPGEISLKRQYFIENGELDHYIDIDITASDEFLQAALGSSKDRRLRDIVSTIQAEQNQIIRADMHGPVIVQGAAGSGKTTIALHRIAYLLYNFDKRLSPEHVLIIAPNRYFLSYISEVLPDLGVENVKQTTYEDFIFALLEKQFKLFSSEDKLAYLINNPERYDSVAGVSAIKSSLAFVSVIERYADILAENIMPRKDFTLCGHLLMDGGEIRRLFLEEYGFLPIEKRLAEVKKYLQSALRKRKPELIADVHARCDADAARLRLTTPEGSEARRVAMTKIFNKRDAEIDKLKKQSSGLASAYFKNKSLKSAFDYYKEFITDQALFSRCCDGYIPESDAEELRRHSLDIINSGRVETEDLAPIALLHLAVYGGEGLDIRHIVIDEAQDVGLFQTYILKKLMNTGSFTILGDLCQGIYSFKGITDWNQVSDGIFGGKNVRRMTLTQSYRTTVEIMEQANIAVRKLTVKDAPEAVPVIRHGNPPDVRVFRNDISLAKAVEEKILASLSDGYQSMAVICKTPEACEKLKERINVPEARILTGQEKDYGGGVVILPSYLAKGLEFDCVVVADAEPGNYGGRELDIKLLYVAMTRALHELSIFAVGELTDVLK